MALNVHWTRISDKNLELDFRYIFVSTDLDLQRKLGTLTKPNFHKFILKLVVQCFSNPEQTVDELQNCTAYQDN